MKDNKKCITISLPTSIWNHCFVGIEENLVTLVLIGKWLFEASNYLHTIVQNWTALWSEMVQVCLVLVHLWAAIYHGHHNYKLERGSGGAAAVPVQW